MGFPKPLQYQYCRMFVFLFVCLSVVGVPLVCFITIIYTFATFPYVYIFKFFTPIQIIHIFYDTIYVFFSAKQVYILNKKQMKINNSAKQIYILNKKTNDKKNNKYVVAPPSSEGLFIFKVGMTKFLKSTFFEMLSLTIMGYEPKKHKNPMNLVAVCYKVKNS